MEKTLPFFEKLAVFNDTTCDQDSVFKE